ncbi:TraM recognition domain-containing protein [Candidatus Kaiserbacteria bacterium]|nr:TraM recognition domain-containing protein [Candidatus Kaiserbacteria bacterium]
MELKARAPEAQKFRTPQEEIAYLRERIKEKEQELDLPESNFESERIAKREIQRYADMSPAAVLHETVVVPEHDAMRTALALEPEEHDSQIDALLQIVAEKGVRNALSVAAKMDNPHIEDDLHRALVRYIAEGLPVGGNVLSRSLESSQTWRALAMTLYEVHPQGAFKRAEEQQGLEQMLASMEQLYAGLLAISSGNTESKQNVFSLEIAVPQGTEDAIFYMAVPSKKKDLFERHVLSIFPNAKLVESRGDYNIFNNEGYHATAYATLSEHPSLPIRTYEDFKHDPMNVLLSAFGKLKKYGEGAAIQIIVGNEGERYSKHYKKILKELHKGKKFKKAIKAPETKLGEIADDVVKALFEGNKKKEEHHPEQETTERVQKKLKTRIVPVNIRILASAGHEERARDIIANLASTFNQFEDPQGNSIIFKEASWWTTKGEMHNFVMREPEASRAIPLNFAELTSIYHLTAEGVHTSRELKQSRAKQSPPPTDMPEDGIILGINHFGATEQKIYFAKEDRMRHMYVVGQTGTGKTNLLKNMIIQDIRNGEGVCYIDPHGSDIQDVLAAIPSEREKDLIYFDPGYYPRPMGLNMLEYDPAHPEQKTFLVDELFSIFQKLYGHVEGAVGPAFEQYFRNSTLLVMEDPTSGNTMVDITRIFANPAYRDLKLSRCKNPLLIQFWRDIATKTQGEQSLENFAQYVTNKFDIFLANEIMRPIIAQEHSAFDFRQVMDEKKILLINLAKGRLGEMNSSLLGLIFVGKMLNAALSRVDMVGRGEMNPFYLYIDEFQNFTTPSIATILSEARKYKLVLTIAHQFIDQLTDDIRDSVFGNVGTRCVFRVGEKDSEFLERLFSPEFNASDIMHLDNFNAYVSLLVHGKPVKPFNMQTIPPSGVADYTRLEDLKQRSYEQYGRPREEVEAEIRARYSSNALPPTNLGTESYGSF